MQRPTDTARKSALCAVRIAYVAAVVGGEATPEVKVVGIGELAGYGMGAGVDWTGGAGAGCCCRAVCGYDGVLYMVSEEVSG